MFSFLIDYMEKYAEKKAPSGGGRERFGIYVGVVGMGCNVLLFISKIAVGLAANSVAVIADAFNNLTDAGTSAVTLLGFYFAGKPADREHPYGHARAEYLTGAMTAVLILLVGGELLKTAVQKILHPVPADASGATAIVLVMSILVKLWMSGFYRRGASRIGSLSLAAAAEDSRNDVFATVGVLLGFAVRRVWSVDADGFIGAAVAVLILLSGVDVLKKALSSLLGEAPSPELVRSLHQLIGSYDDVLGTHDVMVHAYGPARVFATAHAEMPAERDALYCHGLLDNIERRAQKELGVHLVLHLDPVEPHTAEVETVRAQVEEVVKTVDAGLAIHDFRVAKTHDHVNIIFDVEVPDICTLPTSFIRQAVECGVRELDSGYYPVVDIDRNYVGAP